MRKQAKGTLEGENYLRAMEGGVVGIWCWGAGFGFGLGGGLAVSFSGPESPGHLRLRDGSENFGTREGCRRQSTQRHSGVHGVGEGSGRGVQYGGGGHGWGTCGS